MKEIKTIISQIGILCLISFVTLLTLVSCGGGGEDDLAAPQPQGGVLTGEMSPITFACGLAETQEAVTRAATPLSEKETTFQVWGHKDMSYSAGVYSGMQTVFQGYTVKWVANTAATTTTNTNNWDYILAEKPDQTIKYWDWSAKAYRFFAVTGWSGVNAPATIAGYDAYKSYGTNGTYGPSNEYETYSVSMFADASSTETMDKTPYFSRLWFSTGDPVAYPDKQFGRPVTLEFLKPYARVRFIFTYATPREGITLTEKSFKPSDPSKKIYRKGIVSIFYPKTGTETKEWFEMTPAEESALTEFTQDYDPEVDEEEFWYMVLPNKTQGSYTLSVKVNGGAAKTAVVPATYMQWNPGYSYTYVFKITDEGGVEIGCVNYAVTSWVDMEADRTVYNW